MHIKKTLLRVFTAAVIGLSAVSASATPISGDWTGNWSGSGVTATFTMNIGALDSLGNFNGYFDWTCTSGITCSGIENFTGGMGFGDSFTFSTTGFVNPINLGPSSYWGNIVNDGNSLMGFDRGPTDRWSADRVSVPEPSTLGLMAMGLMALGLLGLGLSKRRKLPAATNVRTH